MGRREYNIEVVLNRAIKHRERRGALKVIGIGTARACDRYTL